MLPSYRTFRFSSLMTLLMIVGTLVCFAALFTFARQTAAVEPTEPELELHRGDHICIIGNTLADRMQHHGWLETMLQSRFPEHQLVFRNLGFAGDEIKTRPRSKDFGSPDEWLGKTKADVIFCFFGYNEALRGTEGLSQFEQDLAEMLEGMKGQKYNGKTPPRIVVFSPIAHEDLDDPNLPDGTANNQKLARYTRAMAGVCAEKGVPFVDLFHPSQKLYAASDTPLTMNGVHLLEPGNRKLAEIIDRTLFGDRPTPNEDDLERLRQAVLDRNLHWFSRYRVVDGYNVYGGRSKLAWFGQSNADVMRREMEIFDIMTANRDPRIWAVAQGSDLEVVDNNLPPLLQVKTNKPGPLDGGKYPYLGGKKAIDQMTVHTGMEVNLFASEEMFPEIVNPVQMAVDPDGRLFVSCWPSYPHWNPTQPREDRLVILPDDDRDGVADRCVVFADKLNSVTGFEFWGGGVLVVAPPEIWFLKDTDGDDKADIKLRVLQGVSSADTHHTANGLVIGPDGWLYWSRGVFHVTNMETPTKTFRSTRSGVYRFNPRTFEVEFHFPIGPNPHGDVFDRWGYQFANDGTSGTGSYVNIGKGVGNKQWFKKRVRPVAATGILSSEHFPDPFEGNFLICNTIGFLGVLRHEVKYDGADIRAEEVEPVVFSADGNFRPSDLEVGDDGALYISDWHNALIGHMQHNMRDPNRDHAHGRIYRVTYRDRPLLKPLKLKGKPIAEVCEAFFEPTNSRRYRARLELSGRPTEQVVKQVGVFAEKLDPKNTPKDRDEAQALLECLWVFAEHRVPNQTLVQKIFQAKEPRVRAASIRTLGQWAGRINEYEDTLLAAARDESPLVRAEALKAAVAFGGPTAAEVIFEVANRPTDAELDVVLKYARGQVNIDRIVSDALEAGKPLSSAARKYVLREGSVAQLMKLKPGEPVYRAILARPKASAKPLEYAINGLAKARGTEPLPLLVDLIRDLDRQKAGDGLAGPKTLLLGRSSDSLRTVRDRLKLLAQKGATEAGRRLGYAGWIIADGSGEDAFAIAAKDPEALRDVLNAVPMLADARLRSKLLSQVRSALSTGPQELSSDGESGLKVDYYYPSPNNVALETLEQRTPTASGIAKDVSLKTNVIRQRDRFALRFQGQLSVDQTGRYNFFLRSDDGSRLYIDGNEVINHDGLHGMSEKRARIRLKAGSHSIIVTYFDNGGGDGLSLAWNGPGIKGKQPIPAERFSTGGGRTLTDDAVVALMAIPGFGEQKFRDLAALVKSGRSRASAIRALKTLNTKDWSRTEVRPLIDSLVAYLSRTPARYRNGPTATDAVELARSLSKSLPEDQAKGVEQRLANLDVPVIAIGTVPYRMIYDKTKIVVQAGKPVEFRLSNSDHMPHNLTVTLPGAMQEIGELAEATAQDPDAMARQYVPKSDKILLASRLIQPGQSQALSFEVPKTPGVYPIVCTYPGHWRRMYAALYVVADLDAYQEDAEGYMVEHPLPIKDELLKPGNRGKEWAMADFADVLKKLPTGRNYQVGRELFKVASCVACHKMNGEGQNFGPELTKLDPKKRTTQHIISSMLEPSKEIEDKYRSYTFYLFDGRVIRGLIVKENQDSVEVAVDPLLQKKPTIIATDDIDERVKADVSLMPMGLLNKLTQEEILDLVAYVIAGGNPKSHLFDHSHHQQQP